MKANWDKVLWSWPVQVLNACCFVLIICVVADDCHKTKLKDQQKQSEQRKRELKEILIELKKDSL